MRIRSGTWWTKKTQAENFHFRHSPRDALHSAHLGHKRSLCTLHTMVFYTLVSMLLSLRLLVIIVTCLGQLKLSDAAAAEAAVHGETAISAPSTAPYNNFTARAARSLVVHHIAGSKNQLPYTYAIDTTNKNKTTEDNHDEQEEITIGGNETLIDIQFDNRRDFADIFDPRNNSSLFRFTSLNDDSELSLDHAAFPHDDGKATNGSRGLVRMVSIPFGRWLPSEMGIDAVLASYEASVEAKQKLLFDDENIIISVELLFTCKTLNTGLHRFPREAVTDALDDPRLASCGFSLIADNDDNGGALGFEFGIYATSRGIWAMYNRLALVGVMKNVSFDAFDMYKLLAWRDYPQQILAARIEIDRKAHETRYFLANQLMWTVSDWGRLTMQLLSKRRNRLVSFAPAITNKKSPQEKVPSSFTLYIRNMHKMDVADPSRRKFHRSKLNGYSPALVRLNSRDLNYYGNGIEFYDEKSSRYSCLYGQGAVMGLKRLIVERRRSGQAGLDALTKMLITKHKKRTVVVIDEANITAQIITLENRYPTNLLSNLLNKTTQHS